MRENRTYGSVRGSDIPSRSQITRKECRAVYSTNIMKSLKRTSFHIVALAVLVSMLVLPASASEPMASEWRQEFRAHFPVQKRTSYTYNYTYTLQRFLALYPASQSYIINFGGPDGKFGPGTENAVKAYNGDRGYLEVDGSCGPNTWASIPVVLRQEPSSMAGYALDYSYSGTAFMRLRTGGNSNALYYINCSTGSSVYFHAVVGDIIYG